jgi:raffinose/stachyose/melibiose transport system permease protein
MSYQKKQRFVPYLLLIPAVLIMLIFVYIPVIQSFYYSLFRWNSIDPNMRWIGLDNFTRILRDPIVSKSLWNNLLYALISVVFQVFIALVLAALIESTLMRRSVSNKFRTILFLPSVLAVSVVGITWQLIYSPLAGVLNQFLEGIGLEVLTRAWLGEESTSMLAVIAVSQWQWVGYSMVLFIVAIQAVPVELYEAAEIDGASGIQKFFKITAPMVRETTLLLTIITVIGGFKVFDIVWIMTGGGPNNASSTLGLYLYRVGFRNDEMGYASSLATLLFIITFILTVIQLKVGKTGKEA